MWLLREVHLVIYIGLGPLRVGGCNAFEVQMIVLVGYVTSQVHFPDTYGGLNFLWLLREVHLVIRIWW